MSRESNIAAQQRFGEAVNSGNFDTFNDVVAPNSVDHDPAPGQGPGPAGFRQFFTELRTAFPDLKVSVEHMVADEENVAFAYTVSGTQQGMFMGFAPTGKRMQVRGMQISKFADGKMASAGEVPTRWACCSNWAFLPTHNAGADQQGVD